MPFPASGFQELFDSPNPNPNNFLEIFCLTFTCRYLFTSKAKKLKGMGVQISEDVCQILIPRNAQKTIPLSRSTFALCHRCSAKCFFLSATFCQWPLLLCTCPEAKTTLAICNTAQTLGKKYRSSFLGN